MNNSRRFTGNKFEVYFLPDGATKGKDEIPLHSSVTSMTLSHRAEYADVSERESIPTLKWWELDLESMGMRRDIPSLIQVGGRGIVTVLSGYQPYAKHVDVVIDEFNFKFPLDDAFSWAMHLTSSGPLFDGTYTCEQAYGRIQTDMADGTFLEQQLVHMIPLDQLIDNRFHGWHS
jgi:hypothetical protein